MGELQWHLGPSLHSGIMTKHLDSGPHYCLMVTVYETTCKGTWPLPARLCSLENVNYIMKNDLDLVAMEMLDHISSVAFTRPRFSGEGLMREEARACQEGYMRYIDWQGLSIWEIHPLTLEEGPAKMNHYWKEIHNNDMSSKPPMVVYESPATYRACFQGMFGISDSERSEKDPPWDKNNSASTQQV